MAKLLVDFQLYRHGEPVGDRVSTSLDPDDPADVGRFMAQAVKRDKDRAQHGLAAYEIRVWRHGGEELFGLPLVPVRDES